MDSWDDPTESIMGAFGERSLEIDIDFASLPPTRSAEEMSPDGVLAELWPQARPGEEVPDLVVFDPMSFDLAAQLRGMGFAIREARSGVDVMTLVSAQKTGAVVCGPAEDAERRRLLTAALRLRFPAVPVVYISTHARNPQAVKGAKAEGAELVLPLPLPGRAEVHQQLGGFAPAIARAVLPDPVPPPAPELDDASTQALSADELAEQRARYQAFGPPPQPSSAGFAPPPVVAPPVVASSVVGAPVVPDPLAPGADEPPTVQLSHEPPAPLDAGGLAAGFESELQTEMVSPIASPSPVGPVALADAGLPPPPATDPVEDEAQGFEAPVTNPEANGEVGQLLSAISPFLWGLEDAARYVEQLSESGDPQALTHARTLKLLGKLLTQLQDRVDDLGL